MCKYVWTKDKHGDDPLPGNHLLYLQIMYLLQRLFVLGGSWR